MEEATNISMSLSIPTVTDGSSTSSGLGTSVSLMEDIMDELAGGTGTPDTPHPSQAPSRSDLGDFGLAFELSRQLDRDAAQMERGVGNVGNRNGSSNDGNHWKSACGHQNGTLKVGRLENNSAFKDNAFLRSQQGHKQELRFGQSDAGGSHRITAVSNSTPYRQAYSIGSATPNDAPSIHSRGRILSAKEVEEKEKAAEAAVRKREASKKANAQLPSDDEGSESSDSEGSDSGLFGSGLFKKQVQEQRQQPLQEQEQELQEQNASKVGSPRRVSFSKKAKQPSHEAVIDRMRDRHRALLAEAAAAARDEYSDEQMDDYGYIQQVQPQGYGTQYGMDPSMMYDMDGYIMQQRQQMYYGQGMPHYSGHPQTNTMVPGYPYIQHPHIPNYGPSFHGQVPVHNPGRTNAQSQPPGTPYEQGYSIPMESDSSANSKGNDVCEVPPLSRRGSRQQGVAMPARNAEDSWTEPCPPMPGVSAHRPVSSDSGYCGMSTRGRRSIDSPLEDIQESESGDEDVPANGHNKFTSEGDLVKTIDSLAIAKGAVNAEVDTDGTKSDWDNITGSRGEEDQVEGPASVKSSTMSASTNGRKEVATSSAASTRDGNDGDSESSEDERPIIVNRRSSSRGSFLPPKINVGVASTCDMDYEDVPISPTNTQMSYLAQVRNMTPIHPLQMPTNSTQPHTPYPHHHQQYKPMNHHFPTAQNHTSMGHHHSYSVDRGTMAILAGHHSQLTPNSIGSSAGGGNHVGGTALHLARRGGIHHLSGSKDPRQNGHSGGTNGTPSQSQYPIPATTLLNPLPRRSQSVRVRTQNLGPSIDSPSRQQHPQQYPQPPTRTRGSIEVVRLPNGGYQSIMGLDLSGKVYQPQEPQQRQQHHPLQQHMAGSSVGHGIHEKPQQLHQGYYMGAGVGTTTHVAYHPRRPSEPYVSHSHQQLIQTTRR